VWCALVGGCYLSHRPMEERDGSAPACAPFSDAESFHVVIVSASPEGCTVVGHEFDRRGVRLAEPLDEGCAGTVVRTECEVALDYECWVPDFSTELRGTLGEGPSEMTVATTGTLTGSRCERRERWARIE
jgi:hypothetical protein